MEQVEILSLGLRILATFFLVWLSDKIARDCHPSDLSAFALNLSGAAKAEMLARHREIVRKKPLMRCLGLTLSTIGAFLLALYIDIGERLIIVVLGFFILLVGNQVLYRQYWQASPLAKLKPASHQ